MRIDNTVVKPISIDGKMCKSGWNVLLNGNGILLVLMISTRTLANSLQVRFVL